MQLYDPNTELLALLSLLDTKNDKVRAELTGALREEHFHTAQVSAAYKRVLVLWRSNRSPTFESLLSDVALAEKYRKRLDAMSAKMHPITSVTQAKELFSNLDNFRRLRRLYDIGVNISDKFNRDHESVDVEALTTFVAESVSNIRVAGATPKHNEAYSNRVVKRLIGKLRSGNKDRVIPTGLREFDDKNGGVLRGTNMTIGAPSGEGKSQAAQNIAMNMARKGYRVKFYSLEMPEEMVWTRALAYLSGITVTAMEMRKISEAKYDYIDDCYTVFQESMRRTGGCFRVEHPDVMISMEQLLAQAAPYNYDVIVIDYLSLLDGMGGDDFWRKIGSAANYAQNFAISNNMVVITVVQTDDEGNARLSQMIKDNAGLMWTWKAPKDKSKQNQKSQTTDRPDYEKKGIDYFDTMMPKARMQTQFTMRLFRSKAHMQLSSDLNELQKPWVMKCPFADEIMEELSGGKFFRNHIRTVAIRMKKIKTRTLKRNNYQLRG